MDVGSHVPAREQNHSCWRAFLPVMSRIELHSGYWKLLFDDLPLTVLNSELKVIIYYDSIEA